MSDPFLSPPTGAGQRNGQLYTIFVLLALAPVLLMLFTIAIASDSVGGAILAALAVLALAGVLALRWTYVHELDRPQPTDADATTS